MSGRSFISGIDDDTTLGLRDQDRYLARIVRGQITSASVAPDTATNNTNNNQSVKNNNGILQVDTIDVLGSRNATVPALWFSYDPNKQVSAWGRYQPGGGERVHVGYRNDNSAVVLGYDMAYSSTGKDVGFDALNKLAQDSNSGLGVFKQLNPYEFDFKSGGDAYIFGSNRGTLLLCGGQAFWKLDKQSYRIDGKAAHMKNTSGSAITRFGTVYRKITPADIQETPLLSGALVEFVVDVNKMTAAGTNAIQSRATIQFGDVYTLDAFPPIPVVGTVVGVTTAPLRGLISLGDAADVTEIFRMEFDNLGNAAVAKALNFSINATAMATLSAAKVNLGSLTANQPVVLGTTLLALLSAFFTACEGSSTDPTLVAAASAAITTLSSTPPISTTVFTI